MMPFEMMPIHKLPVLPVFPPDPFEPLRRRNDSALHEILSVSWRISPEGDLMNDDAQLLQMHLYGLFRRCFSDVVVGTPYVENMYLCADLLFPWR